MNPKGLKITFLFSTLQSVYFKSQTWTAQALFPHIFNWTDNVILREQDKLWFAWQLPTIKAPIREFLAITLQTDRSCQLEIKLFSASH